MLDDAQITATVDRGSLSPQRGEISPNNDPRIEPLNQIESQSIGKERRIILPLPSTGRGSG
jgi:hypothetical protein